MLKRILWLVATSQPFVPNIERMSGSLQISKVYVYTYLDALERAGLLHGQLSSESGHRLVRKPAKIFLENTNLLTMIAGAIGGADKAGTVRETFFVHQMKGAGLQVRIPGRGDFLVDRKHLFEIGGKRKRRKQVDSSENAFVVRDDIEVGVGNTIPLWLFGFLY